MNDRSWPKAARHLSWRRMTGVDPKQTVANASIHLICSVFKRSPHTYRTILFALLSVLGACVSHQHRPDSDLLIASENCELVNGQYVVDAGSDSEILASAIFDSEEIVEILEISKSDNGVVFLGGLATGQTLKREIPQRYSCRKSVLTVVLDDQASGDALVLSASDTKVELYSTDEISLTLRFIDSALTFVFIVPSYQSDDYEMILKRETGPSAN